MSLYAIALSIVLISAAVILYLKAYRLLRGGKIRETNSQYNSPTPMLWERGRWLIKLQSRMPSGSTELGRRGFLSRLALGFLCAITARAAARGSELPAVEDFLTTQPWLDDAKNIASLEQCSHSDLTINHIDVYGPGGSHMDRAPSHNDHTDCPPQPPPPHEDEPPPHTDEPHVDTPHGDHGDVAVR